MSIVGLHNVQGCVTAIHRDVAEVQRGAVSVCMSDIGEQKCCR